MTLNKVKASGGSLENFNHWLWLTLLHGANSIMALIPIPLNWMNPRFEFSDRVRVEYPSSDLRLVGIIIGLRYFPDEALTKPEGWEYDICTDDGTILEPTPEDWIYLESQI